jgi:PUB domain
MELRTTEESLHEIVGLYESLRQSPVWTDDLGLFASPLPPIPKMDPFPNSTITTTITTENCSEHGVEIMPVTSTPSGLNSMTFSITPIPNLALAVDTLQTIRNTLSTLPIAKFRKRMNEMDPITNQPRYGEKTLGRVQVLVQTFDFLEWQLLGGGVTDTTAPQTSSTLPVGAVLQELHDRHQQQLSNEEQEKARLEQEKQQRDEKDRQLALRLQKEEEAKAKAAADEERETREAEMAKLRRQAEAVRQKKLADERAEQDWLDSIPKGVEGVTMQLQTIREATKHDPIAYQTAITSLQTIFQQINAHPEETKFRRIRRDHETFQADIGRHKGGIELLIAAGFTLGAIDDVPCFLSKEPNIEKDMDGWSAWFDLLKGTLEVLNEELTIKR